MKKFGWNKLAVLALLGCLTNVPLTAALGQGTAFTYQGVLNDGASPATGLYTFKFDVFNAGTSGTLVAGPVTNTAVPVTNGIFTTVLDFGPGVFSGTTNWLHVQVTTNGGNSFISLLPRQELTPTPYAIYAEGANAANLTGMIPTADLTGVALLAGGNNFTGDQTVTGTVQINGPEGITGASGAGFHADENIGPNTYYSGEEHGINFNYEVGGNIGSMIMGWAGQGYFSVGNFYGTGSGTKAFTVFGSGNVNVDPQGGNMGFLNNGNTNGAGLTFGVSSGEGIASQRLPSGSAANQYGLDFYTDFARRMSISQGGLVGINIGTNKPTAQLEVNGPARIDGNWLYLEPNNGGSFTGDGLVWGDGGLPGINNGYGPFLAGYLGGALGGLTPNTVCLSWDSTGNVAVSNRLSAATLEAGSLGINTYSPSQAIEVNGNYVQIDGSAAYDGGGAIDAYIGGNGSGSDVQVGSFNSNIGNVAFYNWGNNTYMHIYCSQITIEGGSDLAEPFKISSDRGTIPAGAVVVIDEQNPGRLKLSDCPYDTRVAGVVSGANGINPGIQMHQQGLIEGGQNVALSGRVYVQADASNGPIKPGDMLTTSSVPGYAMKVTDHARAEGAILGKAMTGLPAGRGMVLVLVTLQ